MRVLKIAICIAALCGVGCASNVKKHWGEAYEANTTAMIANPDAGQEPDDGVSDLEGTTVETVMEQYRKEQTQSRAKKNFPTSILIQGMAGSGGN
jgi:type IV pilus biogenesis protein CpaD/CtpE